MPHSGPDGLDCPRANYEGFPLQRQTCLYLNTYKQYVRPHLEFSVAAWAPRNQEDCETLERVQWRAEKAVSGLKGQSYEQRLAELKLPSLSDR